MSFTLGTASSSNIKVDLSLEYSYSYGNKETSHSDALQRTHLLIYSSAILLERIGKSSMSKNSPVPRPDRVLLIVPVKY